MNYLDYRTGKLKSREVSRDELQWIAIPVTELDATADKGHFLDEDGSLLAPDAHASLMEHRRGVEERKAAREAKRAARLEAEAEAQAAAAKLQRSLWRR